MDEGDDPSSGALDAETNNDKLSVDGSVSKTRNLRDVVTPLAHITYDDQLEQKKASLMQILKKLVSHDCFQFIFVLSSIYTFLT